jgi:hypothetical protein
MPKVDIDYSNTIIYKIYCKDSNVNEIYVGHTTNFIKRKYSHKIESNRLKNQLKIYSTIRQNGGWDNWDMVEIAKYNCKDKTEARIKEQKHFEELKANLNSCPPFVDKNSYFCKLCNLQCNNPKSYETHINCELHKKNVLHMEIFGSNIKQKISNKYCCEKCKYFTDRKSNIDNHLLSAKHLREINENNINQTLSNKICCEKCNKIYQTPAGLWKHIKKCNIKDNTNDNTIEKNEISDKDLIMILINENKEFKTLMLEQQNMIMKLIEKTPL